MADKQYKEWLAGLKVDDNVIVDSGACGKYRYDLSEVMKVTPTHGLRIRRYTSRLFKNGRIPATEYDTPYRLLEPTDELLCALESSSARRHLNAVDWDDVNDDIVRRVRDLLR